MEEEKTAPENPEIKKPKKHIPEVYILRDWKEYAGESLLIIFSVLLALILTEYINYLHENKETKEILQNIRTELVQNKQFEQQQYAYDIKVVGAIDSALANTEMQKKIFFNGEFNLKVIAPAGILYNYLNSVAWDMAKSHNILSKIDFKTNKLLSHIYGEQTRIMKVEDEAAKIILSPESRKPENARVTLILLRDNYHAWALDRAQGLLDEYTDAIKVLGAEE